MTKRRLFCVVVLLLAVAAVPALASVYQPQTSDKITTIEANGGAVIVVKHQCSGLGSSITVIRAGARAATIIPCSKKLLVSDPSITVDHADGWLVAVWAQANPFGKGTQAAAAIYAAVSRNGGRTFAKPELLHTIGGSFPSEVAAGAYAHRLWVLTAGFANKSAFSLQQFDLRFHQALPPIQGLSGYHVLPSSSSFRIYAIRDGVVALWQSIAGGKISWYAADTERINPTDMTKAVRFVPRGKIADQTLARLFVGADGMLYRLRYAVDMTASAGPQLRLSLDRWYFRTHSFAAVGANDGFLKTVPDASASHAPVIAAGVGADGSVELLLAPLAKNQTKCLYTDFVACTLTGVAPGPVLELDRRNKAGSWTSKPVALPAPGFGENAVAATPFSSAPWNLIVTANSSLLVDVAYAKASAASADTYDFPFTGARHTFELLN